MGRLYRDLDALRLGMTELSIEPKRVTDEAS